jgi:peptidoglycan L-alanyl-D-glutamate endopeptidase CwlK
VPSFGKKSLERLESVHPDLQAIAHELIKEMDVSVLCGHRTEKEQQQAFISGHSKLTWPRSKHNSLPSRAVDIVPFPLNWSDIPKFNEMCDRIEAIAKRLGIKVRMGRSFSFKDYPHCELSDKNKS